MHFTMVTPNNMQEIISIANLVGLILRNFVPSVFFVRNQKILRMLLIRITGHYLPIYMETKT